MSVAVVTGAAGLIGSEAVAFLHEQGLDVVGVDNDMRAYFFGPEASTTWNRDRLAESYPRYTAVDLDVRDAEGVAGLLSRYGRDVDLVIHCAAQPSHDWAAREPLTDFHVNATGTLNFLEATRLHAPEATFITLSTNKVYGDAPNDLPLVERDTRWELDPAHPYAEHGFDETLRIDQSKHSLFGASKVAADVMTQEYGRYFGMNTAAFRGGCLTGPQHSGAELHGFLAYLVRCAVTGTPYTIFGYKGKQVRDNIHSHDLVTALWAFHRNPRPGAVYNIGGSRHANCSVLEAIEAIERLTGRGIDFTLSDDARSGDHIWWISDIRRFREHHPDWEYRYGLEEMLEEIIEAANDRFAAR
ncbi:MAG: NAD-dependent epimerase/dehydratase family protein [Thermoleophilia bacterium]